MAEITASKTITLKTSESDVFEVEHAIALEFGIVKSFIGDADNDTDTTAPTVIPLPNVSSRELAKIVDYCEHHIRFRAAAGDIAAGKSFYSDEAKAYNADFVKGLSFDELKELILAANYLNVRELLDFLNQTVADLIQNKSVEFVRNFFGIVNDYTPEEEARIRAENEWAFEGVDED